MSKKVVVVGAGFGGLSAACLLSSKGYDVTVLEKNSGAGGRARVYREKDFVFDMGPSWYLMPEVFDSYFELFGKRREDYYDLFRLDPYYQVFFEGGQRARITANIDDTLAAFEAFEPGGADNLKRYLAGAKYKYDVAMREFLHRDYRTVFDFLNKRLMTEGLKLNVFSSLDKYVSKYFSSDQAKKILEYAMVFLGNSPTNAPALYSIMSHVDLNLGVWYPKGGLYAVVEGLLKLAAETGVKIRYDAEVRRIVHRGGRAAGVETAEGEMAADIVLVNADYAHTELELLDEEGRSYSRGYWDKAVWAPSMFIAYLGTNRKIGALEHHNLYFAKAWERHFTEIFDRPAWPGNPSFYASCPSRTDPLAAPAGKENIFLLVPVAPGLEDTEEIREEYFEKAMDRFEGIIGEKIRPHLVVKRIYSQRDFIADYHAWKGTALGLAHTLRQTAVFRPARRSKKIKGLYFSGHYTHPGVGVPMTFISSRIAAEEIRKDNP
jgi:phytoene desaturase